MSLSTRRAIDRLPLSSCQNSLDYGLQVHLQISLSTVSKPAQSRPPSVSPNSLDCYIQVHLHTRLIAASKCISKFARSQPPSTSPNSPDHGLQLYLQTLLIRHPNSHYHGILVHLHTRVMTASKCISRYAGSWPPRASPNSLYHSFGVYLWVHSIVIFRSPQIALKHRLQPV